MVIISVQIDRYKIKILIIIISISLPLLLPLLLLLSLLSHGSPPITRPNYILYIYMSSKLLNSIILQKCHDLTTCDPTWCPHLLCLFKEHFRDKTHKL